MRCPHYCAVGVNGYNKGSVQCGAIQLTRLPNPVNICSASVNEHAIVIQQHGREYLNTERRHIARASHTTRTHESEKI